MKNLKFQSLLKKRGMTHAALARQTGINRSVLTRVLGCAPGKKGTEGKERGKELRLFVRGYLTNEEAAALGWEPVVLTQVEQCST